MSANLTQIQSIIDLNESNNRNMNGWEPGSYKDEGKNPSALRHAKNKKLELNPAPSGYTVKLINNWPTSNSHQIIINGVDVGSAAWDPSGSYGGVIIGGFKFWCDFQSDTGGIGLSGAGTFLSMSLIDQTVEELDTMKFDFSEAIITSGLIEELAVTDNTFVPYVAVARDDLGVVTTTANTRGFTVDEANFIFTGPNF